MKKNKKKKNECKHYHFSDRDMLFILGIVSVWLGHPILGIILIFVALES